MPTSADDRRAAGTLGAFGGVFTPNVLTILGVIMFLRTGWVVGAAGLAGALVILLLAKSITILTSLSISSISTNTRVGAGGAYFLISRSLGLEIGGSIGVPLYFAQAISVAFYLVGFAESLTGLVPGVDVRLVASAGLGLFFVVAWFGAGFITKTQYFILGLLTLSIISMFTGVGPANQLEANLGGAGDPDIKFFAVFAIFFPAVTGIMAGVSMSGDLKDPGRSIPRGTIAAVLITMVVYAAQMIWMAARVDRETLLTDQMALLQISSVPQLIYVGLWAASLSSALASLAAAPRTLQALAHDRVAPHALARTFSKGSREPRAALIVTVVVAEICILLGDINAIAQVITMFFLATYGTLNLVAGIERLVSDPSYRPSFRTHWAPSLLGGVACLAVMLLINVIATIVAVVVIAAIYAMLTRRRLEVAWGDVRSGVWFSLARFGLRRFVMSRQHLRNWRPIVLVLVTRPDDWLPLVTIANWLESRRGFLFMAQVIKGEWKAMHPLQASTQAQLETFIRDQGVSGAARTVVAEDYEQGVSTLLQLTGVSNFAPNTVLVGWSDDATRQADFARTVRRTLELERNLIVYRQARPDGRRLHRRIDVWWYARDNGSLMLTLAWLLKNNPTFREHEIRVLRIIRDPAGIDEARAGTQAIVEDLRVVARVEVIVSAEPPFEVIADTSAHSDVTFVGLAVSGLDESETPLEPYAPVFERIHGRIMLTKSWQDLQY